MRSQSPTSRSTQYETSFYWPATVGAKSGGIRELKTTIQTTFCHRCSPHLYSALDSDRIFFYWPAAVGAKSGGIRELKTTIQTTFCHRYSPHLYSAINSGGHPFSANGRHSSLKGRVWGHSPVDAPRTLSFEYKEEVS